jgi:hypothetical protein
MHRFVEGRKPVPPSAFEGTGGTAPQTGLLHSGFTGLETMKKAAFIFFGTLH